MKRYLLFLALFLASTAVNSECRWVCEAPVVPVTPSCSSIPPNTTVINTGMPASKQFRVVVNSSKPDLITSFKFNTDPGNLPVATAASVAILPGSMSGKTLVISKCPGGPPVTPYCYMSSSQAASVRYYTNINKSGYCILNSGETYYANVLNKHSYNSTSTNCTTSYNCRFLFEQH